MQKVFITTIMTTLFLALGVSAQEKVSISPEKIALVKELIEVTGSKEQSSKMMETMMGFQEEQTRSMIATMFDHDNTLSAADKAEAKEMAAKGADRAGAAVRDFFSKEFDIAQMIEDVSISTYGKHFSESELRDMIAFYRTPTGQKLIKTLPDVMLDSMTAISEKLMPKLQDVMKKVVDEESANLKREVSKKKTSNKL